MILCRPKCYKTGSPNWKKNLEPIDDKLRGPTKLSENSLSRKNSCSTNLCSQSHPLPPMDKGLYPKCSHTQSSTLNRSYSHKRLLFTRSHSILPLPNCNKISLLLPINRHLPVESSFLSERSLLPWVPTQCNLKFNVLDKFPNFKSKKFPIIQKLSMWASESQTCFKKTSTISEKNSIKSFKTPLFNRFRTMSKTHTTLQRWDKRENGSKTLFPTSAGRAFSRPLTDIDLGWKHDFGLCLLFWSFWDMSEELKVIWEKSSWVNFQLILNFLEKPPLFGRLTQQKR